jgi:hypothetical protein
MTRSWMLRSVAAVGMVGVVHVFTLCLAIPSPAAWILGAMIYAGLLGVLLSHYSMIDKLRTYGLFVVVTYVGAGTVCPCTGAHFIAAPIAGLCFLGLTQGIKEFLRPR